jgi:hypothetical protein
VGAGAIDATLFAGLAIALAGLAAAVSVALTALGRRRRHWHVEPLGQSPDLKGQVVNAFVDAVAGRLDPAQAGVVDRARLGQLGQSDVENQAH